MLQLMFDDFREVQVPSAATLCRARPKVDLAMMYLRRRELAKMGIGSLSIQLSHLELMVMVDGWCGFSSGFVLLF